MLCRDMGLRDLLRPRYDGALRAVVGGIVDRLRDGSPPLPLDESDRLDGRTCLVTGANRGLGLAIATDLVRRGAHVILACRSGIPGVLEVVRRRAGGPGTVEAMKLDLGSLDAVERFVDELAEDGARVDVVVLNAGVVPRSARRTGDGFDEGFQVNFLADTLLVMRLLERGVIPNTTFDPTDDGAIDADDLPDERRRARIVAVSSESHRSAPSIAFDRLGAFRPWAIREAMREYALSKLLLETWCAELARRLGRGADVDVSVHTACPGAVHTDLAREAPSIVKPALEATMRRFFKPPAEGAHPFVHLAARRALEGRTGLYAHVNRMTRRDPRAEDATNGRRLWDATARLLRDAGHPIGGEAR